MHWSHSFYTHYPLCRQYDVIEQLVDWMKQAAADSDASVGALPKLPTKARQLQLEKLLQHAPCTSLLKLLCDKHHVSYTQFLDEAHAIHRSAALPKLLLHCVCYFQSLHNLCYVSQTLGVAPDEAEALLMHWRHTFKMDDPIRWLENFLLQNTKERQYCAVAKAEVLHGAPSVVQPQDTAEERRQKKRRAPKPTPPIE